MIPIRKWYWRVSWIGYPSWKREKGKGKKNVVRDEDLEDNYEDTEWDGQYKVEYEQKKKIERMKEDNKKSERMEMTI